LAACEVAPVVPDPPPVPPGPEENLPDPPVPDPVIREPSQLSRDLSAYYARVERQLLSQGLLRGEGAPTDAPFTATSLADNFIRIALFDEYVDQGGTLRPEATESRLRRWDGPVRMGVEFGGTVPLAQAQRDRASVAAYGARLARITGLPITQVAPDEANFHVLFLNEDDRLTIEPTLRRLAPGIAPASIRAVVDLPRTTYCLVIGFADGSRPVYSKAIVVIRAEHPDLLRLSCIHEEIAQGLGLVNDSPLARPSLFNDNEEFGRLTRHDELLLRILYDDRLSPGMTVPDAAPIARAIAAELLPPAPV
jgi:hypothetical protein